MISLRVYIKGTLKMLMKVTEGLARERVRGLTVTA